MKLSTLTVATIIALAPGALTAQGAAGAAQGGARTSARAQGNGATGATLSGDVGLRGSVSAGTRQQGSTSADAQAQGSASGAAASAVPQQGAADARIRSTLAAAAAAHLPTQLLESKVAEGRAKHVPEDRIAAAVEARYRALLQASGALRDAGVHAASAGDLAVAADALQAGVSQSALVKLEQRAPVGQREVATATLAQLVQLGYGSDAALLRVDGALAQGEEALANLRAEAASSLRVRGLGVKIP